MITKNPPKKRIFSFAFSFDFGGPKGRVGGWESKFALQKTDLEAKHSTPKTHLPSFIFHPYTSTSRRNFRVKSVNFSSDPLTALTYLPPQGPGRAPECGCPCRAVGDTWATPHAMLHLASHPCRAKDTWAAQQDEPGGLPTAHHTQDSATPTYFSMLKFYLDD